MSIKTQKIVYLGLGIAAIVGSTFIPETQPLAAKALLIVGGKLLGKELLPRSGDVHEGTHPDDMP